MLSCLEPRGVISKLWLTLDLQPQWGMRSLEHPQTEGTRQTSRSSFLLLQELPQGLMLARDPEDPPP